MGKCILCNKKADKIIVCQVLNDNICFECCFAISSGREGVIDEVRDKYNLDRDVILSGCDRCISGKSMPGPQEEGEGDRKIEQVFELQSEGKISKGGEKEKEKDSKKSNLFEGLKKEAKERKEIKNKPSDNKKE
ncbi:hypothetical protein KAI68_01670, partial [bacterium]|nr:hypothetical protein [bacterium]